MPRRQRTPIGGPVVADKFIWARARMLWAHVRDSLWFLPAVLTALAALLAVVLVQLERNGLLAGIVGGDRWLLASNAEGARQLLSAIVGGLMTVTGVVFSVTIVALQLASSQFTPRVLRNFSADRSNQIVLGVLIGTFTYAMLVLRAVRSESSKTPEFVPQLAVALGVGLALVSIGWLIYFINHVAASMRISVILDRVARETLRHVRQTHPERFRPEAEPSPPAAGSAGSDIGARRAGYLQAVDLETLFQLGRRNGLEIRMACAVGQFLLPGQALAQVSPPDAADERIRHALAEAFVIGNERTPNQDVEFGIIEIADIAIKALSPGINDPTTAMRCIDRQAQILLELGQRSPAPDRRVDGRTPLIARHLEFERALGLAFDQIRHFGADNPAIAKKLIGTLTILSALLPPQRHPPLIAQAEAVLETAHRAAGADTARDLERIEREFRRICGHPAGRSPP